MNADVDAEPDLLPELARRGCRNLYGFGEGEGVYSRPLSTQVSVDNISSSIRFSIASWVAGRQ